MTKKKSSLPIDPVRFISRCLRERKLYWTYHVNMRSIARAIPRSQILDAAGNIDLVEQYPDDKYFPSYLMLAKAKAKRDAIHILFAVDVLGDNVRVVTAYRPDLDEWEPSLLARRRRS